MIDKSDKVTIVLELDTCWAVGLNGSGQCGNCEHKTWKGEGAEIGMVGQRCNIFWHEIVNDERLQECINSEIVEWVRCR